MNIKPKWVVVQHSGYAYAGKESFRQGLETRSIHTQGELTRVLKAGGIVFDSYGKAESFVEQEEYPNLTGLIPNAPGKFSNVAIDGLRIYIPISYDNITRS